MFNNTRAPRLFAQRQYSQPMYQTIGSYWAYERQCCFTPDANVLELDDRFLLEVALPGVVLDDVDLKSEQHSIVVRAKRLPAPFEEDAIAHIQEMPFANLIRTFEFNMPILPEQVEARMDRGILYISVPKLEVAHRIHVAAGAIDSRISGMKTQVGNAGENIRQTVKSGK